MITDKNTTFLQGNKRKTAAQL